MVRRQLNPASFDWRVYDATGQILGRFAEKVAKQLMGKHKPTYNPTIDSGDGIIIINASKVALSTRKKWKQTKHFEWTGRKMKEIPLHRQMHLRPEKVLHKAIRGMLPRNRSRKFRMQRCIILPGAEHDLQQLMQQPLPSYTDGCREGRDLTLPKKKRVPRRFESQRDAQWLRELVEKASAPVTATPTPTPE